MHTRHAFKAMGWMLPPLLLGVLSCLPISGCSSKAVVQAEQRDLPRAETRTTQEVRTPLPPPQIDPNQPQQPLHEASPKFPSLPDWNTTIWDISSP